jgi:hypothetical protein
MSESTPIQPLTPEEALEIGYERSEPNALKIGLLTVVIVFTIIVVCYAVYYWYVGQLEYTRHMEVEVPVWQETKDVRAYETERLTQFKYLDKAKGSVQLPIEKAMNLLVQENAAGKAFYGGANSAVKPYEVDPNLQTVIDKALGKTPLAAPPPAANDGNAPAPKAPVATAAPAAKH